jgi:oligoendopeptidase F
LFEVPFYYIEYGIAQLGALGVWKNFKSNPKDAIVKYKEALKLGYSKAIPTIYQTAGLKFDFSAEYLADLAGLLKKEINKLKSE